MPILRPLLALVGLTLAATGCAAGTPEPDESTGDEKGKEIADARVHALADELAADLEAVSWLERQRHLDSQVPVEQPVTSSGYPSESEHSRELMAHAHRTVDGRSIFDLTVRIRVHFVPVDDDTFSFELDPPGEATVARCFAYVVEADATVGPEVTQCPEGDPIPVRVAEVPDPPSIGPRDHAAVWRFLRSGGTTADVGALAADLRRGLTPSVEQIRRAVAVAVSARPDGTDCIVGMRRPGGRVLVWAPDRIMTMPGEYGCRPSLAVEFAPGYVAGA